MNSNECVVLLSGGLDSTVLLNHLQSYSPVVVKRCLSINYGQMHAKEVACANWHARKLGIEWKHIDLKSVYAGIDTPLISGRGIPSVAYEEQEHNTMTGVPTYVPNRNMILLSVAAAHAIACCGGGFVAYAAHKGDYEGNSYPDCTPEFVEKMNAVLETQGVTILTPFIELSKAEIVAKGYAQGLTDEDFAHTWSCYNGGSRPCGVCGTCRERIAAFTAAGKTDPLEAK